MAQPPAPVAEPQYPEVESFIERASSEDIGALFASVREGLKDLKGPRAPHAKKVALALDSAEELLRHLLQVREQLTVERRPGKKGP